MFAVVTESLEGYESRAIADVENVGVRDAILMMLRVDGSLSAGAIAERLRKSARIIERHISELKAAGRIRREGPPKTGRWIVIEESE